MTELAEALVSLQRGSSFSESSNSLNILDVLKQEETTNTNCKESIADSASTIVASCISTTTSWEGAEEGQGGNPSPISKVSSPVSPECRAQVGGEAHETEDDDSKGARADTIAALSRLLAHRNEEWMSPPITPITWAKDTSHPLPGKHEDLPDASLLKEQRRKLAPDLSKEEYDMALSSLGPLPRMTESAKLSLVYQMYQVGPMCYPSRRFAGAKKVTKRRCHTTISSKGTAGSIHSENSTAASLATKEASFLQHARAAIEARGSESVHHRSTSRKKKCT